MAGRHFLTRMASFYIYFAIFSIIFFCIFVFPVAHSSGVINTNYDTEPFNVSQDPVWILHITDIHVSPEYPNILTRFPEVLKIAHEKIKPSFVIMSGDLVDNYETNSPPTKGYQIERHWELYNESIDKSNIDENLLFEVFGNHDIWGINEWNEGHELPAIYTRTKRDNFYSFSHTNRGVRVVGFVPQDFPTGSGPLAFFPALNSNMLDRLYEVLQSPSNSTYTIVATHFPTNVYFPKNVKSSKGFTYEEILSKNGVIAVVDGHTHPKTIETLHIGNLMELTGVALKAFNGFQLVTIDNGRLQYSYYDLDSNISNICIVTSPGPSHLAAHNFADKSFPIRLLSFSNSQTKHFNVSGDATGELTFDRYLDGTSDSVSLYSMNCTFPSGIHTIHISGDWNEDITFAVDTDSGPFKELITIDANVVTGPVGVGLFLFFLTVIIIFIWVPCKNLDVNANYILGTDESHNWYVIILLGPAVIGRVMSKFNIYVKCFLTTTVIWPICLPVMLYPTEGKASMFFAWGYVSNGIFCFDVFAMLSAAIYFMGVSANILNFGSSHLLYVYHGYSMWILMDIAISIGLFCLDGWFAYKYIADIGWPYYWIGSFSFIIFPLVSICLFLFFVYKNIDHKKIEATDLSENESNDGKNNEDIP